MAETPTLRPLGVGEVLDAGIKLYLRHWKPLMICVVGVVLPIEILSALVVSSIDPESITDEEMGVFPDYEAFCAAAG